MKFSKDCVLYDLPSETELEALEANRMYILYKQKFTTIWIELYQLKNRNFMEKIQMLTRQIIKKQSPKQTETCAKGFANEMKYVGKRNEIKKIRKT